MAHIHNGKTYRSYKHPILEYIFENALKSLPPGSKPEQIPFTYEDIRTAMRTLGIERDKQASLSNFTIDLTRKAAEHQARVPDSIWEAGYDLDRMPDREARQNYAGRLVLTELKPKEPWIVWPNISSEDTLIITNVIPDGIRPYLGNDEGALLSAMDYCDVLSLVLYGQRNTVIRVQHPKKWQPGEIDGLYFSDNEGKPTLYPVEAKALSTGDHVNLAQIQGAYNTTISKISGVSIVPLAVQMSPDGMFVAVFEADPHNQLILSRSFKVKIEPPIESWQSSKGKKFKLPK